jgi:nitrogen fixation/metabolism regulation signal transduction histidine kinase
VAKGFKLGRFELQVRLFLVLLLLFLGILDLLNIFLLAQAKGALEVAVREGAVARGRELAREIGPETLLAAVGRGGTPPPLTPTAARRITARLGYDRVALLDRAGREVLASGPPIEGASGAYARLSDNARSAITAGRPATGPMAPRRGGAGARLTVYVPILDGTGRMAGMIEAIQPVPELGRLTRAYRLVLIVQLVGVLVIATLVVLFAGWISRPYRRLAAALGEAALDHEPLQTSPEPDELAAAFRTVVEKLKEQDETLRALGKEGSGLGELVRFASRASEDLGTGVLVVDRHGRVAAINPAAGRLIGCEAAHAVSGSIDEVARHVAGLAERVRACLDHGKRTAREVLDVGDGSGGRHVGVSISPAGGWEGEVAGALVLLTDLTEIRELRDQARLRESLAEVGRLSAGIAHEFRNALSTILGYARLLQKEGDPRVKRSAVEIVREVESVGATVDEFLLYAKPPEPARSRLSLLALLQGCAAAAEEFADVRIEGEFGDIVADEALLRRAFGNLFRNSADALADEGRRPQVRIGGRRVGSDRTLQIDFEDDGPGIPVDLREQVFEPFFTTRARGTGLGLALVQRTILDLGGTIEAAQASMGGALFRIRLPLAGPE